MREHPTTLLLLTGRTVKVVKVWYSFTRNVWRVEYEGDKGCLAERFEDRWEEVDRDSVRQRHPAPLAEPNEPYGLPITEEKEKDNG